MTLVNEMSCQSLAMTNIKSRCKFVHEKKKIETFDFEEKPNESNAQKPKECKRSFIRTNEQSINETRRTYCI